MGAGDVRRFHAELEVALRRVELFAGLYDDDYPGWARVRGARTSHVVLLNPSSTSDDPIARRFAQLEID
jgi:hypothetical protein